jgi:hypothetical protein
MSTLFLYFLTQTMKKVLWLFGMVITIYQSTQPNKQDLTFQYLHCDSLEPEHFTHKHKPVSIISQFDPPIIITTYPHNTYLHAILVFLTQPFPFPIHTALLWIFCTLSHLPQTSLCFLTRSISLGKHDAPFWIKFYAHHKSRTWLLESFNVAGILPIIYLIMKCHPTSRYYCFIDLWVFRYSTPSSTTFPLK